MSRIGRAIIEVLLKSDQAKAEVRAVKTELDKLKSGSGGTSTGLPEEFQRVKDAIDAAKASSGQLSGSVKGVGEAAASAGGGFMTMAVAIGAAVLAGVGLAQFLDEWLNRAETAQKKIDDLTSGVRGLTQELGRKTAIGFDSSSATKEIVTTSERAQAAISSMNERLGNEIVNSAWYKKLWSFSGIPGIGSAWRGEIESAYAAANQLAVRSANYARELRAREADEKAKADEAAGKRQTDASQKRAEALGLSQLDGMEKLYTEENIAVDDLNQRRKEARTEEAKAALDHELEVVKQVFIARRGAFLQNEAAEDQAREERAKREETRMKEAAERVAKHQAEVLGRELERVTNALISNFNQNVNAQQAASNSALGSMTSDVSRIADIVSLRLRANGIDLR